MASGVKGFVQRGVPVQGPSPFLEDPGAAQRGSLEALLAKLAGISEQFSGQEVADINQRFDEQSARVGQNLVESGLGATTIAPTLQAGVERARGGELNRAADARLAQRLGFELDVGSQIAGTFDPQLVLDQLLARSTILTAAEELKLNAQALALGYFQAQIDAARQRAQARQAAAEQAAKDKAAEDAQDDD